MAYAAYQRQTTLFAATLRSVTDAYAPTPQQRTTATPRHDDEYYDAAAAPRIR